jgi:hypothetical protein
MSEDTTDEPADGGSDQSPEPLDAAPIDSDPDLEHRIELNDPTPTIWVVTDEGGQADDD